MESSAWSDTNAFFHRGRRPFVRPWVLSFDRWTAVRTSVTRTSNIVSMAALMSRLPAFKYGSDMTISNRDGRTALRAAANGGDIETVRLLLSRARKQEKLEEVIHDAGPTVAIAADNGFREIVELLLQHGADPNRSSGSRGNGLNHALMAGRTDIARILVAHGADVGALSQPGDTPSTALAAYTELDDLSAVQLLREHGADFTAVHDQKETALTWARMRGHPKLIDSLSEAGVPEGEMPRRPEIPSRSIEPGVNQAQRITRAVQKSIDRAVRRRLRSASTARANGFRTQCRARS